MIERVTKTRWEVSVNDATKSGWYVVDDVLRFNDVQGAYRAIACHWYHSIKPLSKIMNEKGLSDIYEDLFEVPRGDDDTKLILILKLLNDSNWDIEQIKAFVEL